MNYSVKFNDSELGEYIDVLQEFTPFSGAGWSPELQEVGNARGDEFAYTTYGYKSIPMPFTIFESVKEKYDNLQRILNVSSPKPLIFEGAPDRVFYAIPSSDLEFEEDGCLGTGTITWIVPDGLAHSTAEKSFEADTNSSGILEVTISNAGTESVPVDYTITHNNENGFIGIVSEYGAIELGDIKELDGETAEKSQLLMNYRNYSGYSAMTTGQGIFFADYVKSGTFKETTYEGTSYLDIDSAGAGTGWHGAAKSVTIPADFNGVVGAQNFALQAKAWFRPTAINQLGIMEYAVADEDGAHLMSVRIAKHEPNREAAYLIFCIGGKEAKRIEFQSMHSQMMVHDSGQFYMAKSGDKFEFSFGGIYQFCVPELEDKKAKTVSVFIGQRDSYPMVERMRMQYLTFRKDNVTDWRDIPNRYQEGDVIYIDGKSGKTYKNGSPNAGDEVRGSAYFKVPPGETKVQFFFSDFCEPLPFVTAKIREAYL